jgi:hypothetical protein
MICSSMVFLRSKMIRWADFAGPAAPAPRLCDEMQAGGAERGQLARNALFSEALPVLYGS